MTPKPDRLYALEKLGEAVHELATGAGRVQRHLGEAALYLIRIRLDDLPDDEARRMFLGIKDDLTFDEPRGDEGRIAGTLAKTDDADAREIARRILELHNRVWEQTIRESDQ